MSAIVRSMWGVPPQSQPNAPVASSETDSLTKEVAVVIIQHAMLYRATSFALASNFLTCRALTVIFAPVAFVALSFAAQAIYSSGEAGMTAIQNQKKRRDAEAKWQKECKESACEDDLSDWIFSDELFPLD